MNSSLAAARLSLRAALRPRALAPGLRGLATQVDSAAPVQGPRELAPTSPQPAYYEDDPQLADYPRLPFVSKQTRTPFGWDDMQMRRNFGETVRIFMCSRGVRLIRRLPDA